MSGPPSSFSRKREPRAGARQGAVSPSRRFPHTPPSYRRKPVSRGAGHLHHRHGRCTRAPNPSPQARSQNPFALSQSKGLPHFVIPAEAGIQRCERAGRLHPQPPPTPPSSFPRKREPRAGARQGAVSPSRRNPAHPHRPTGEGRYPAARGLPVRAEGNRSMNGRAGGATPPQITSAKLSTSTMTLSRSPQFSVAKSAHLSMVLLHAEAPDLSLY